MSGIGWPGLPSCQRMTSINKKPNSRNSKDVIRYWIPMTLWSTEKTYLRMKLSSGWW